MPISPVNSQFIPNASLTRSEMEEFQRSLASIATFDDTPETPSPTALTDPIIIGVDQAFCDEQVISAVVAFQDGEIIERTYAVSPIELPYIPGLLAFREGGPICDALDTLTCTPDLALFDGSGRIHYRQAGLATHIGVIYDLPSVGIAKSLLCGTPQAPTDRRPVGWRTPIRADEQVDTQIGTTIGYAYQSKQYRPSATTSVNPLYVSPGHRVSAETATELVAALCTAYKLPGPTQEADRYAAEVKQTLR